jgi:hypothetical protein
VLLSRGRVWPLVCAVLGGCLSGSGGAPAAPRPDAAAETDASQEPDASDPLADFVPSQDPTLPYRCEIGIAPPSGDYEALAPGGVIPIAGIGQAGLTARAAVRIEAEPPPAVVDEAIVALSLTNVVPDIVAESRPLGEPVPFECRDDGACYRGPVHIEISHLAPLPELEGLAVGVALEVTDLAGVVLCRSRGHGLLDRL